MPRNSASSAGIRIIAILAAGAMLTACSSAGLSSFGSNKLTVAQIDNIGSYSADTALAEARSHFRNNNFGHAAALYERVVELSPQKADGYVGLSASYDRLGRFDLSDRVYASLYKIGGGTVQYYNNVGYSYMLRGSVSEAIGALRKAASIDPDNPIVANNLRILSRAAQASRA